MKIFILLVIFSLIHISVCDSQNSEEKAESSSVNSPGGPSKLSERLSSKFNGKISDDEIEEYEKDLKSKLNAIKSKSLPGREDFKRKLEKQLAEMREKVEREMSSEYSESDSFKKKDKNINDEL